jgi:hypothetical protein
MNNHSNHIERAVREGKSKIEKILHIKNQPDSIGKRLREIVDTTLDIDVRSCKRQRLDNEME